MLFPLLLPFTQSRSMPLLLVRDQLIHGQQGQLL
nr:hypothetical protein Q903MT_gene4855 [Picea sitchensis]